MSAPFLRGLAAGIILGLALFLGAREFVELRTDVHQARLAAEHTLALVARAAGAGR